MLAHDKRRYNGNAPHTVRKTSHSTILPIMSLVIHARSRS